MDLSPASRPAIALLVDGENLSRNFAPDVLRAACRHGPVQVRRVYGNMNAICGWEDHGFRLCPTRPGKNAADMLLCVEAMALVLRESFETLVIASSDRDFSYLAEHLREIGKQVVGLGRETAPESFKRSCSVFIDLNRTATHCAKASERLPVMPERLPVTKLIPLVRAVLANATAEGGWSTANWISVGLKKQVESFDLSLYSDRPIEETLIALNAFEVQRSNKATLVFRWPASAKPKPAPHTAP